MSEFLLTRRAALLSFGALTAAGLSGCNTAQTSAVPGAIAGAAPVSGYRIGSVVVDS